MIETWGFYPFTSGRTDIADVQPGDYGALGTTAERRSSARPCRARTSPNETGSPTSRTCPSCRTSVGMWAVRHGDGDVARLGGVDHSTGIQGGHVLTAYAGRGRTGRPIPRSGR
jgi:hypothetical protein